MAATGRKRRENVERYADGNIKRGYYKNDWTKITIDDVERCYFCGKFFGINSSIKKSRYLNRGQEKFFCSQKCSGAYGNSLQPTGNFKTECNECGEIKIWEYRITKNKYWLCKKCRQIKKENNKKARIEYQREYKKSNKTCRNCGVKLNEGNKYQSTSGNICKECKNDAKYIHNYKRKIRKEKFDNENIFDIELLKSDPIKPEIKIGLYFLWKNKQLVYIGKSTDIDSRISSHIKTNDIDFDEWTFFYIEPELLNSAERVAIRYHKPKCNKVLYIV